MFLLCYLQEKNWKTFFEIAYSSLSLLILSAIFRDEWNEYFDLQNCFNNWIFRKSFLDVRAIWFDLLNVFFTIIEVFFKLWIKKFCLNLFVQRSEYLMNLDAMSHNFSSRSCYSSYSQKRIWSFEFSILFIWLMIFCFYILSMLVKW